jgi:hypothetical protein
LGNQTSGVATGNAVLGIGNTSSGIASGNGVLGIGNQAYGIESGNAVAGFNNQASGFAVGNFVLGANNQASGAFAGNSVIGLNNIAIGTGAGNGIIASNTVSIGTDSNAAANNSIAFGAGAQVASTHVNSAAIGAGAQSEFDNEISLGAKDGSSTYTTPGITSSLSKSRQSGPLEVVTTDSAGHLASDGGEIFEELGRVGAGIAIATAMENPDLVGNEKFGLAANLGFFEGNTALSVSAMGVIGHNLVGDGERWAISGGVGVSLNEDNFGGQKADRALAGRAGVQITW